jgi:hypothetical protein
MSTLPRNLIVGIRAGLQMTKIGSEKPFSLDPLRDGEA